MITCPDKRTKNWKQLVKAVGEPTAYAVWNAKEGLVEDYLNSLSQPTTQPQAGQTSDTETKKQEIQDKIDALKKQLPTPKLVMPQQVSGRIGGIFNELRAVEKASSRTKAKKEEALYKKYGTEAVDKAKALNYKFQNIVAQLIEKKLNFFYDEETQEHVKRCF